MQQDSKPPRRFRRWLRLAALIAGIGALAVLGAVLGRGLGAFEAGDAEARAATATPAAVAVLATAATPIHTAAPPSPTAVGPESELATPAPSAPSPTPPSERVAISPSPHVEHGAAGAGGDTTPEPQVAARLPRTGGDQVVFGLGALGIALYLAGVALFVVPRMTAGKKEKE